MATLKGTIGNSERHSRELKGRGRSTLGEHRRCLLEKVPLGSSRRVEGRPHSAADPLSITNTMSQSMMVCSLQTRTYRLGHMRTSHKHRQTQLACQHCDVICDCARSLPDAAAMRGLHIATDRRGHGAICHASWRTFSLYTRMDKSPTHAQTLAFSIPEHVQPKQQLAGTCEQSY